MKKLLSIIFAFCITVSLVACSSDANSNLSSSSSEVVVSSTVEDIDTDEPPAADSNITVTSQPKETENEETPEATPTPAPAKCNECGSTEHINHPAEEKKEEVKPAPTLTPTPEPEKTSEPTPAGPTVLSDAEIAQIVAAGNAELQNKDRYWAECNSYGYDDNVGTNGMSYDQAYNRVMEKVDAIYPGAMVGRVFSNGKTIIVACTTTF